ncbi:MAG: DUF882 domain-containing protein [Deltaproteobacteria bacterium]|jgi:uncharacterized protein YcbK (DUF882 family)|nr:DUF882 domain-containing protein [Deltaproteobacteria bacterium]
MKLNQFNTIVSRRVFLKSLCLAGCAINLPSFSYAAPIYKQRPAKVLSLFRPETKESLTATFWIDGNYVRSALSEIDYIMRDLRTEKVRQISTKLLNLLHVICLELGTNEPFHILSGYRCPETNAFLKKKGWAVASQSLHEKGKAVDIRLPKVQVSSLRRAAYHLKLGGVGYYPQLNFVHVDVGSIRYWRK